MLLDLGEADAIHVIVGKSVIQEADEVIRRKAKGLIPVLAQLLDETRLEIGQRPNAKNIKRANQLIVYPPDAFILAEALEAEPDWFVTHDRQHFLNNPESADLPFSIGTPGDILAWFREQIT